MTNLPSQDEQDLANYVGDYLDGKITSQSLLDPNYQSSPRAMQFRSTIKKDASISLRLPQSILDQVKSYAHKQGIPYQTLITSWIYEKIGG